MTCALCPISGCKQPVHGTAEMQYHAHLSLSLVAVDLPQLLWQYFAIAVKLEVLQEKM